VKNDELLDRLSAADPITRDRVARDSEMIGDLPRRIVAGEFGPSRVQRLPRRRLALGLAAAVVAIGVAVPLALLLPLGGERTTPSNGWVSAGSLASIRAAEVVYLPDHKVFVVAPAGEQPYALSGVSPHLGEDLLFCQTSGWFFDPSHGEQFDLRGNYELGPAPSGMVPVAVEVVGGQVRIDPSSTGTSAPRGAPGTDDKPDGSLCHEGATTPIAPGIVAATTQQPLDQAITVSTPNPNDRITSPVRIAGTAEVFEAVVHYEILDADGSVIAQGTTNASCGTGCRGHYSVRIDFAVDHEQDGIIRLFGVSEMDAQPQDVIDIPVTIEPGPIRPIFVGRPFNGEQVSSPLTISGSANVFEATVSYQVLDEQGTVIAEGTTMATCGSGCRGTYSVRVRFSVDHAQQGTVRVYEVSAKDGSDINVVEVPVVLMPKTG
jgi:nitrite reductase/ring-hydroxylating ferredoxin subunit